MFRKLLVGIVASLSLVSPLALPTSSQANEHYEHRHGFEVLYRRCPSEPWQCAGSYRFRDEAFRAAAHYRHRGFEAFVR